MPKPLLDKLRGSHLDDGCRDRQRVLGVILRAEKAAAPWGLCGDRLNGRELVGGQNLRVRRHGLDLVEVRAERVEHGRTGREKRVRSADLRHGDGPSHRELASPRVQPDRSPERDCGKLQTPAAPPDGHAGGKAAHAKSICRATAGVGS